MANVLVVFQKIKTRQSINVKLNWGVAFVAYKKITRNRKFALLVWGTQVSWAKVSKIKLAPCAKLVPL